MNLKTARFLRGLTQIELQNLCGIHQSRLSLLERGLIPASPEEKRCLEAVLGPNLDWTAQTLNCQPSTDHTDFIKLVCAAANVLGEQLGLHFLASLPREQWQKRINMLKAEIAEEEEPLPLPGHNQKEGQP